MLKNVVLLPNKVLIFFTFKFKMLQDRENKISHPRFRDPRQRFWGGSEWK